MISIVEAVSDLDAIVVAVCLINVSVLAILWEPDCCPVLLARLTIQDKMTEVYSTLGLYRAQLP